MRVLIAALAGLTVLAACGADDAGRDTNDTAADGGGTSTGTTTTGIGTGGAGGAGGSIDPPEPVPCDAQNCASFDCVCGDGSTFRGFRSCKASTNAEACPGACAAFGGWVESGAPTPPDVGPLVASDGVRAGQSCGAGVPCSLQGWGALCADGSTASATACESGTCADYAAAGQTACSAAGTSFVDHTDAASGSVFVRSCTSVDWLRFVASKNVLDDAAIGDAHVEASGAVRVAGTFHGHMDLGAGDESCSDGGLFLATYAQGALKARSAFCFFGNTSFDPPRLTQDGLYAASLGSIEWKGAALEGSGSGGDWTLVHAALDGSPAWTRHITSTSPGAIHLVAVDDLGAVIFLSGSATLWDSTVLTGNQLVRVSPGGAVIFAHEIQGMTGGYADLVVGGSPAGHLLLSLFGGYAGDVVFNGTTLAPGGPSSHRIVALLEPDATVGWSAQELSAVRFHVGSDGTTTLVVGGATEETLERRDSSGDVLWSKPLPVPTTPHLYYVYGWGAPHVGPSGAVHMTLMLGPDEVMTFAGVTTPSDSYPAGVGASYVTAFDPNGEPKAIHRFTRCAMGGRFVPDATGTLFVGTTSYCLESAAAADPLWSIATTSYDTRNGLLMHVRE